MTEAATVQAWSTAWKSSVGWRRWCVWLRMPPSFRRRFVLALFTVAVSAVTVFAVERAKPLKALLVIGGCCHDYAAQKDILKQGIEKRINVKIDIAYSADTTTTPALPILG